MTSLQLQQFKSRGLDPIDLRLGQGECVTLAGPSGCGKSLLLRAIADLDPHEGECLIGDRQQSGMPPPEWRRQVGLLPAESHWWTDRVGDQLIAWNTNMLEALGFTADCLDWEIARLSSGERQRLALARLLTGRPLVLLLDEPTANLDRQNSDLVERLITDYLRQNGAAALWVSHDRDQRRRVAERGFMVANGALRPESWN